MKKKKRSPFGLIIILLVIAATILLVRHFHIKNFNIIEPEVLYISGQPRGMDYTRLLYKYHIATIVNIRSISEHRERNWYNEEITWVRNNGVNYFGVPIGKHNYFPDKQTQDKFLAIMADKNNLPVLLHGSSGEERVSMLTAVWVVKAGGYSFKRAVELAEKINKQPLTALERDFIKNLAN